MRSALFEKRPRRFSERKQDREGIVEHFALAYVRGFRNYDITAANNYSIDHSNSRHAIGCGECAIDLASNGKSEYQRS